MNDPVLAVQVALVVAALIWTIQLLDVLVTVWDARTVSDGDAFDARTRRRIRELFWTLPVTAAAAVLVAFGVDGAGRFIWEAGDATSGISLLVGSALAAFAIGCIAMFAIAARERPTYARLRRDLADRGPAALSADEIAEFDRLLERVDRSRTRTSRRGLVLRILASVIVIAVAGSAAGVLFVAGSTGAWFYVVAAALDVVFLVGASIAARAQRRRLNLLYDDQRNEVVAMLERARIPQRGSVPGLRDRVSRALAILREKQR